MTDPLISKIHKGRWGDISEFELMNLIVPVLYKVSGTGKILEWYVSVHPCAAGNGYQIHVTHGQQNGRHQTDLEAVTEGKNLGRSNETSPLQQACFQAVARWKKQLDRAYRETVEEAQKAAKAANKPMLAYKFLERGERMYFDKKTGAPKVDEVILQAKVDGMRCLATKEDGKVTLISRGSKAIESVPYIATELAPLMNDGEVWDGELYKHGMEFEEIMSICRRGAKNLHPKHTEMEFHIFDVVAPGGYLERTKGILWTDDGTVARADWEPCKVVPHLVVPVTTWEALENRMMSHLEYQESQGYEGVMLRCMESEYQHKKCADLLKLKSFDDEEFQIVGSLTGTAGTAKDGLLVNFICAAPHAPTSLAPVLLDVEANLDAMLKENKVFKAPLCGKEQKLREMWERRDTYVGEMANVMFQEKTKFGVPRFPKCKGVRGREDLS
jgi:DNA ligase-1